MSNLHFGNHIYGTPSQFMYPQSLWLNYR